MTHISERYSQAVEYARAAHHGQIRTGTRIPYLYHVLAVSSMVMEYEGDEDQAIAGLLHDVVEDCGAQHADAIRSRFGERVHEIVMGCTDGTMESKEKEQSKKSPYDEWRERKLAYLDVLAHKPDHVLLVVACDKLHNTRAILRDAQAPDPGLHVFERFHGGIHGTLAYHYSIARILHERTCAPAPAIGRAVMRLHALVGSEPKGLEDVPTSPRMQRA